MELEVLRVMQSTREDEALVAAVQGTAVEDGRDALAQVAALLQECMDASSWRDCRVGLYEIDALIDEVIIKEEERRAMEDAKQEGSYDQI